MAEESRARGEVAAGTYWLRTGATVLKAAVVVAYGANQGKWQVAGARVWSRAGMTELQRREQEARQATLSSGIKGMRGSVIAVALHCCCQ